jgi:thiol:disulfide interchange protein DsbA
MRLLQRLFVAASFSLLAFGATASFANPVQGVDYQVLPQAQPTDSGSKVEVLEFFWYNCPHCAAFEPQLAEWAKKKGDTIVFKRVPVYFRESFVPQQKLYYALEALGKVDTVHRPIFDAIHSARIKLDKEDQIVDFVEKQGVDRKKFLEAFNSESVPTIIIDGRFMTSPAMVGSRMRGQSEQAQHAATLQVMDALIAKKK